MSWSANHNCVSNAYRFALGTGQLKGIKYENLKINVTDSNFYLTNYVRLKGKKEKNALDDFDYNFLKLGDLRMPYKWYQTINDKQVIKGLSSTITPTNLRIGDVLIDSFNKDTGLTPEDCYEHMIDLPASAKIFSVNNNGTWVTGDLDWDLSAKENNSTMTYFKNEYDFSNDYSKTEYRTYILEENKLEENVVRLSAESFLMDNKKETTNKTAMDCGAAGVLLTYEDTDRGLTGDNELPVAYFDFGKTLHSNFNFIQVDWHEDGVISVE